MSDDADDCPELVSARVPVTILTGFLGSGKTTLLHYVLTAAHHLKIAVIVNEFEFGKSIEKGLTLRSSEKADDEWVELKNGCMCCSAQRQTVAALESLIARKGTFDLILIETAGLADPAPVAAMFWQDAALCGLLYLSGIVTLVDAVNIEKYLGDKELSAAATRQIVMADKILLNKCDLASAAAQGAAGDAIARLNPAAEVIRSSFARVDDLEKILFVDTTRVLPPLPHIHTAAAAATITAVSLELSASPRLLAVGSRRALDELCSELLYKTAEMEGGVEVVRCKAALWVLEGTSCRLWQLQTIGQLFDVQPMERQSVPYGCSRALILGRHLSEPLLRDLFTRHMQLIDPVAASAAA